mmetsp:Transcript_23617/g.23857  ORF Transcript_23617/g.23857 Transcript_23617/m.23857 type:complete len:272 (+) Transcript_23617:814-1629(+)
MSLVIVRSSKRWTNSGNVGKDHRIRRIILDLPILTKLVFIHEVTSTVSKTTQVPIATHPISVAEHGTVSPDCNSQSIGCGDQLNIMPGWQKSDLKLVSSVAESIACNRNNGRVWSTTTWVVQVMVAGVSNFKNITTRSTTTGIRESDGSCLRPRVPRSLLSKSKVDFNFRARYKNSVATFLEVEVISIPVSVVRIWMDKTRFRHTCFLVLARAFLLRWAEFRVTENMLASININRRLTIVDAFSLFFFARFRPWTFYFQCVLAYTLFVVRT